MAADLEKKGRIRAAVLSSDSASLGENGCCTGVVLPRVRKANPLQWTRVHVHGNVWSPRLEFCGTYKQPDAQGSTLFVPEYCESSVRWSVGLGLHTPDSECLAGICRAQGKLSSHYSVLDVCQAFVHPRRG